MAKNLKTLFLIITIFTISQFITSCCHICTVRATKDIFKGTTIDKIDLSKVKDGIYTGFCDMILVNAMIHVTVKNKKITELILLEHRYNKDYSGAGVIENILQKQSLEVDCVSGATISSRAILKATERALKIGMQY